MLHLTFLLVPSFRDCPSCESSPTHNSVKSQGCKNLYQWENWLTAMCLMHAWVFFNWLIIFIGFIITSLYNEDREEVQGIIDSQINMKAAGKKMIDSVRKWLTECSYQAASSLGYFIWVPLSWVVFLFVRLFIYLFFCFVLLMKHKYKKCW